METVLERFPEFRKLESPDGQGSRSENKGDESDVDDEDADEG